MKKENKKSCSITSKRSSAKNKNGKIRSYRRRSVYGRKLRKQLTSS